MEHMLYQCMGCSHVDLAVDDVRLLVDYFLRTYSYFIYI
jgi:hypothetical protein